jgi:hypothetical protein
MVVSLRKIDESPVDGNFFYRQTLEELSKEGVTLVSRSGISIHLGQISFKWLRSLT